jgi:formate/nitrite transporter FocA (FNT family)
MTPTISSSSSRLLVLLALMAAVLTTTVQSFAPIHHRHRHAVVVPITFSTPVAVVVRESVTLLSSSSYSQSPVLALKAPPALYEGAVAAGVAKANMPFGKIFVLGIVAGCHIAFGAYLMLSVGGACPGLAASNPGLQRLLSGAMGLPTGLIMCLVTGAELFTGNTALVTAAYMEGKVSRMALAKNWVASYAGNFVGSLLLAYLAYTSGTLGAAPAAVNVALAKCSLAWNVAFVRGILCNWLVCMAVYMASGCSTMIGKMSTYLLWRLVAARVNYLSHCNCVAYTIDSDARSHSSPSRLTI